MVKKCPPGFICTSGTTILLICILIIILGASLFFKNKIQPIIVNVQQPQHQPPQSNTTVVSSTVSDARYMRAPQPLQSWLYEPEIPPRGGISSIPIGIPTRGLPEKYQSIGIINIGGGEILPLYGRRTGNSSDRWNYYTRTDTYNPIQIPIRYRNKECTNDIGCPELFSGEDVYVDDIEKSGKVKIYPYDGPKYIAGLV